MEALVRMTEYHDRVRAYLAGDPSWRTWHDVRAGALGGASDHSPRFTITLNTVVADRVRDGVAERRSNPVFGTAEVRLRPVGRGAGA
jgi:hypothetical protein